MTETPGGLVTEATEGLVTEATEGLVTEATGGLVTEAVGSGSDRAGVEEGGGGVKDTWIGRGAAETDVESAC